MKLRFLYQAHSNLVLTSPVSSSLQSLLTRAEPVRTTSTKYCPLKRYLKTSSFGSVMFHPPQRLHSTLQTSRRIWRSGFRCRRRATQASVPLERRSTPSASMKLSVKLHWTVPSEATSSWEWGTRSEWSKGPTKGSTTAPSLTAWRKHWYPSRPKPKCNRKFRYWAKRTSTSKPNVSRWRSTSKGCRGRRRRSDSPWTRPTNKKKKTSEWLWPNLKLI